jgi:N-acetylmuramoyl-L-alanine amidase
MNEAARRIALFFAVILLFLGITALAYPEENSAATTHAEELTPQPLLSGVTAGLHAGQLSTLLPTPTPVASEPATPARAGTPDVAVTPISIAVPIESTVPMPTAVPIEAAPPPEPSPTEEPVPAAPEETEVASTPVDQTSLPEPAPAEVLTEDGGAGRIIALDPGHGGRDPGVPSGAVADVPEKDLTLQIAERAAEMLRADGFEVVFTREGETTANPDCLDITGNGEIETADEVQARIDTANAAQADLLISIHLNAYGDTSVGGTETYYCAERPIGEQNQELAALLQQSTFDSLAGLGYSPFDRGIDEDSSLNVDPEKPPHIGIIGPVTWLIPRPSEMPGVLWEPLFITSADEDSLLQNPDAISALGQAVDTAVNQYFEEYGD